MHIKYVRTHHVYSRTALHCIALTHAHSSPMHHMQCSTVQYSAVQVRYLFQRFEHMYSGLHFPPKSDQVVFTQVLQLALHGLYAGGGKGKERRGDVF